MKSKKNIGIYIEAQDYSKNTTEIINILEAIKANDIESAVGVQALKAYEVITTRELVVANNTIDMGCQNE